MRQLHEFSEPGPVTPLRADRQRLFDLVRQQGRIERLQKAQEKRKPLVMSEESMDAFRASALASFQQPG